MFSSVEENLKINSQIILDLSEELQKCSAFQNELKLRQADTKRDGRNHPCKAFIEFIQDSSDEDDTRANEVSPLVYAQKMLNEYMNSSNDSFSGLLNDHKCVAYLFLKYNTSLRSNAACERLFSMAKYILTLNRCKLSDRNFEEQLLLKANRYSNS